MDTRDQPCTGVDLVSVYRQTSTLLITFLAQGAHLCEMIGSEGNKGEGIYKDTHKNQEIYDVLVNLS